MEEIWRPVVGHESAYQVSNLGRVRRIRPAKGTRPFCDGGFVLRLRPTRKGYWHVALYQDGLRHEAMIHILVAQAFLGVAPSGFQVNHKDGNKDNNRLDNLEWMTAAENTRHAIRLGLTPSTKGEANGRAKLTAAQVSEIRDLRDTVSQKDLASRFGVSKSLISAILRGEAWAGRLEQRPHRGGAARHGRQ